MISLKIILIALTGGLIPAIVWLLFWLKEDSKHPESPYLITKVFIGGMCAVLLVIPFQKVVNDLFSGDTNVTYALLALIEEAFKLGVAYFLAIRIREDDEPIDPVIYMISVSLGFVALENGLFILSPIIEQNPIGALYVGGLRFVGASLLHVLSSAVIGIGFALTFYKSTRVKVLAVSIAFVFAFIIHTLFNIYIAGKDDFRVFIIFGLVWTGIAMVLLLLEKIKTIAPK